MKVMLPRYDIVDSKGFLEIYGDKRMVDLGIDDELLQAPESIDDEKKLAIRFGIIGAGQAGGNLADAFWASGYRRVCVVNTTTRDMQRLQVPHRHVLKSDGGAGKNPAVGRESLEREYEEVFRMMQSSFKRELDHVLICVGAGGGSGSGAVVPLIKMAKEYLVSIGVSEPEKKVGVICTLPTKDESSAVQRNALDVANELCEMSESGQLSPLILVDNARVMQMFGAASVVDVWGKANKNIVALFNSFNELCAIDDASCHVTCDPKDYKTVMQGGGVMAFGRTKLEKVVKPTDVADAVRDNVKKGLLVEGLDLSTASKGAALLVSGSEGLSSIPQEALENAFASLNRLMKQGSGTVLHRGVYEVGSSAVYLYTIIGGMSRPMSRLKELHMKSGGAYPIGG